MINVQSPASVQQDDSFRFRNSPILMQVGENSKSITGYYYLMPGWENSHWIDSFSYGLQSHATFDEKTPGKPIFLEIAVIRKSDAATPIFFQHITKGSIISSVTLVGFGNDQITSKIDWEITLENVIFTSMAVVGMDNSKVADSSDGNLESITMKYQRITVSHTLFDRAGDSIVSSCWDVVRNKEC